MVSLKDICSIIKEELDEVEARLKDIFVTSPFSTTELAEDILSTGGKRLRPSLLLLSAKACGYKGKEDINLATAIELVHTATLIHDDVIDNATLRRGKVSVNSKWGNHISILVGDYLFSKAMSILITIKDFNILDIIAPAISNTCMGEIIQSINTSISQEDVTEEQYLEIISQKTASLISASCHCGAYLGGQNNGIDDIFRVYGQYIGIGFQIIDDILDFIGDERYTGKSTCNDLYEKKITLPIILFLKRATNQDKARFKNIWDTECLTSKDIKWILNKLHYYQSFEYAKSKAVEFINRAKEKIIGLPDSEAKQALLLIGDYIIERNG
jgi:octaprenyl-diphosphate synthase